MNARAQAIRVLSRVRATDAFLNAALDADLSQEPPRDDRDRNLVTELCYGTTRRQLGLDRALSLFVHRRLETLEDRVLAALRVGAYQLFFLRVPARAAVAETVEALKELGLGRASGFVNAVLRRLSELPALPLPPPEDFEAYLEAKESHPRWLVSRWIREFGPERTQSMLEADNAPPPLVLRANSTRVSRDELLRELASQGIDAFPTRFSPAGVRVKGAGRVDELFGFREGLWQVQDEAAQLVGLFAEVPRGARVLDLCAAPGGKACHLAERAHVLACDVQGRKLAKLVAEAERLGLSKQVETLEHDATRSLDEVRRGRFDLVLVDAPCSGLGTLRRHPELRYRRTERDVGRLAALQKEILEGALSGLAPGGLLVYSVCSPEEEEGQEQARDLIERHPELHLEAPVHTFELPDVREGLLRTFPGPEGLDGFFAARFRCR